MSTDHPGTPPGWYPDPQNPGWLRYWNGAQWTDHQASAWPVTPPAPEKRPANVLVVLLVAFFGLVLLWVLVATLDDPLWFFRP